MWPDKNRGKGVGLMQTGFGIGFFLASVAWYFIFPVGPNAWRVCSCSASCRPADALDPAVHPGVRQWERVNEQREAASERETKRRALTAQEKSLARFTVADLFAEPLIRRRVILAS